MNISLLAINEGDSQHRLYPPPVTEEIRPGVLLRWHCLLILYHTIQMKFSIVILGAPYTGEAAETAYRFAQAVLEKNHEIYRLFFYHEGVHNASSLLTLPQDEVQPAQRWQELIDQYQLDAVVCIASALRRGVLNETEAKRFSKPASNLMPDFAISGLGELIDAALQSDRLITFGASS